MADSNTDKMDMSLDDIIKMTRQPGRGRGGGRGGQFSRRRGGGGDNRGNFRNVSRGGVQRRRNDRPGAAYSRPAQIPDVWQHDLYDADNGPARRQGPPRGGRQLSGARSAKLIITNLDYGVNDQDIKELFAEFGPLKHSAVHYDRSGRSLGTADVEYESSADAVRAMKQYNNVPLDGKPMKISLDGDGNAVLGDNSRSMSSRLGSAESRPPPRNFGNNSNFRSRGRPGGRRGSGGQGRGGRDRSSVPSKEDLDAELDAYNAKMETD